MGENTKIEWAHHTFNPWIGCQKVGPGCDHCYAEKERATTMLGVKWGPHEPRHRTSIANWRKPLAWDREAARKGIRYRVFCASLADVFDNAVPVQWRMDLFNLIHATPHLDWMLLTKRIGNVAPMSTRDGFMFEMIATRCWLGITVVNQEEADRDIPKLLAVPAARRFLSMEPLLGAVNLTRTMLNGGPFDSLRGGPVSACDWPRIDWVIVGGESGPHARPMHPAWVRGLRDQCAAAVVPFLFKQWGEWTLDDWGERPGLRDTAGVLPSGEFSLYSQGYRAPFDDYERLHAAGNVRLDGRTLMDRVGKLAAGRLLDGIEHNGYPA